MPASLRSFTEAAADAVAREIASLRREAQRERELREAEHRARMAELDARIMSVADLERRVVDRLATLKDGDPGKSVTLEDMKPVVQEAVQRAVADAVEAIPPAKDIDSDLVKRLVDEAVAAIPSVEAKEVDPEMVRQMVADAVAAIPPAKDGRGIDDVDVEKLDDETIVLRITSGDTEHAFEIGLPEGKPGASVSLADVEPLLREMVAALPAPEPGKSVTMDDVRPMVEEAVQHAVAAIPTPKDGNSVTIDDVRPVIEETVARAVAEIPKPKDGAPGKLPVVEVWTDRVHYEGCVRAHRGSTWQALRDTAKEPPHEDWICIARGGSDGRSFTVRGTYEDGGAYQALDVVALNGAAFVARRDDPGQCPGEGWQMIAMQGKPGKPGPSVKGDRGPPGPGLQLMEIDGQGMLTAKNADGSIVRCDLYPVLSRLG